MSKRVFGMTRKRLAAIGLGGAAAMALGAAGPVSYTHLTLPTKA
jgi:hypothetical protein